MSTPTVTVAPGVEVNANMTPTERYNAVAKSLNAPTVERPAAQPQFHIDATVNTMQRGDAQSAPAKAVVPVAKPAVVEQTPEQKIAAFDAEQRAAGKQLGAPPLSTEEQQSSDIELLSEQYRLVVSAGNMPPEQKARFKAAFERDVAAILEGNPLTPAERTKLSKSSGNVESFRPKVREPVKTETPPASTYTPEQWEAGHKEVIDSEGMIPLERLNVASLSGFTIPKLIEGQTVNRSVFRMLAAAKIAGITQAQVDTWCREQLRAEGLLK